MIYMTSAAYAAQAVYHAENARSILLNGGHTAESVEEKAELHGVLIQVYRVLGQAYCILKK